MTDAAALVATMPFAVHIGVEITETTKEAVTGHLDWSEDCCTIGGLLHGGALMTLADSVGALCAFLGLPEGATTATTGSTTHLFRAVTDGTVTATARPLHRGRRMVVVQTDLVDTQGRRVAQTTQTQAVLA